MTENFNDYLLIMQARKSRKFKKLDDQVRTMSIELGKSNPAINRDEYEKLLHQRNQELKSFAESTEQSGPTFDRSLYTKIDPEITTRLDTFIAKFPNTKLKNIVLMGATGTGKTYCAQLINHELTQRGFTVCFTSTFNLVKRMKDYMFGQDNLATTDFLTSDLLIIDDLGTEPTITNSDEYIYAIINERYFNQKSFIITTNLTSEQILGRYSERLFGRIFDKARTKVFEFNGKDLRIE